jgi:hypothetical protein
MYYRWQCDLKRVMPDVFAEVYRGVLFEDGTVVQSLNYALSFATGKSQAQHQQHRPHAYLEEAWTYDDRR